MRWLAVIIPGKIPSKAPNGVQRICSVLSRLPDDYCIYYEHHINPQCPDFIIISPNLGLLLIEIRNWYPKHIREISENEVIIEDKTLHSEMHPLLHAKLFLDSIYDRARKHPLCTSLFSQLKEESEFNFPIGSLFFLSNCTISRLSHHDKGSLIEASGPGKTMGQETIKEMERMNLVDLMFFLRTRVQSSDTHLPLTYDQVHAIRAIIHPEIIVNLPGSEIIDTKIKTITSLKTLDYDQEKRLYQIPDGHYILFGPVGSGKTAIMISRAGILHNRYQEHRILVLCYTTTLRDRLLRSFERFPRIDVFSFVQWAEKQGVVRFLPDGSQESDQEFGSRLYQQIILHKAEFHPYDAIFIDEGNEYSPSWFQCAREALKNPEHGDLFIIADGQKGFRGPGGIKWNDIGIHIRGHINHQGIHIEKNYQNTREILNLARLFLLPIIEDEEEEYNKLVSAFDSHTRSGLKPLLIWNTSHEHQVDYMIYLIQRLLGSIKSTQFLSGMKPDDIAILYPYAEGEDKNLVSAMITTLGRFCPVQWVSEESTTYQRVSLPGVKVHDCHSIKELHYRAVMILFTENFERFFIDSEFFSDRMLLSVALTRPLDFLSMQYTERTDIIRKIIASGYVQEIIVN